ncbi:MAG TPA: ABC transporter substrate-binding protein [Stellaceae bacterium]|nr:ABC transporter substrate-binding protein [Stellaceae bacterium]
MIPLRAVCLATLAIVCGLPVFRSKAMAATTLSVGKADANASPILPVNIGEKLGIFAKHGIDVKIADFTGGSKLIQAMTAGSVDIGVAAGPLMALAAKGAPVVAVCNDAPPIPFIGIAVPWNSPIHSADELKGKKIGISSAGSLTDWLAQELARERGWGPQGVTPVAIGNGATSVIAAFRTQAIDADISVTSNIFAWEEKKEGRLLIPVSKYVGNIAAGSLFATNQLIASNPDALRGFLAAWLETVDYMRDNKSETVKIESGITGYSPGVMSQEYDLTIGMFSKDCKFDAESLANLQRSFVDLKLVDTPLDMSKLYTEAFLPK